MGKIRENVLTEANIRTLVKLVDEEMDGVAKEQRQKLETIEAELADVKRRLGRLYDLAETTDLDIDDFKLPLRTKPEPPIRDRDVGGVSRQSPAGLKMTSTQAGLQKLNPLVNGHSTLP